MTIHTPGQWEVGEEVDSDGRLVYIPIRRGKLKISTTGVYGRRIDGSTAGAKYTGGHIEEHVDGIGWVVCEEPER